MLLALALHFDLTGEAGLEDLLQLAAQELQRNHQWQQQQKRWLQKLHLRVNAQGKSRIDALARAFSDRIGYQQESGRFRLNSGISVESQSRVETRWALFPIINPKPKGHTGIAIALQLSADEQRALSQQQRQLVFKGNRWQMHCEWRMGGVVISEEFVAVTSNQLPGILLDIVRDQVTDKGLTYFQWSGAAERLLQRARVIASHSILDLPALDDEHLIQSLDAWLLPFLNEQTRFEQLPWLNALEFYLGYDNCQAIARVLPEKIELPSGRQVVVDFSAEGVPQVSAKLQEFFGCEQLELAAGKLPLKIHLLSPNGIPLAITTNLQTFWQQAYPDVRKEMRGKYPRHPWPENPLEHEATALTKRKLALQQK